MTADTFDALAKQLAHVHTMFGLQAMRQLHVADQDIATLMRDVHGGNKGAAKALVTSSPELGNVSPLELMQKDGGRAQLFRQLLNRREAPYAR